MAVQETASGRLYVRQSNRTRRASRWLWALKFVGYFVMWLVVLGLGFVAMSFLLP